jgi:hypothetical protein
MWVVWENAFKKRIKVLYYFTDSVSHKIKINVQIIEKV